MGKGIQVMVKRILSLLLVCGSVAHVNALTVAPARTEIRLLPGKSIVGQLDVRNETANAVRITVSTKDWFVLEDNKEYSIDKWLDVKGAKQFSLDPGKARTVKYRAQCPPKAKGELVGMVSFLYEKEEPAMVTPMISVSVYLTADGTEARSGEIRSVALKGQKGSFQVECAVRSTGNVHIRPRGNAEILDASGKVMAQWPLRSGDPVYPGTDRNFISAINELAMVPGKYVVRVSLEDAKGWEAQAVKRFTVLKAGEIKMEDSI